MIIITTDSKHKIIYKGETFGPVTTLVLSDKEVQEYLDNKETIMLEVEENGNSAE